MSALRQTARGGDPSAPGLPPVGRSAGRWPCRPTDPNSHGWGLQDPKRPTGPPFSWSLGSAHCPLGWFACFPAVSAMSVALPWRTGLQLGCCPAASVCWRMPCPALSLYSCCCPCCPAARACTCVAPLGLVGPPRPLAHHAPCLRPLFSCRMATKGTGDCLS